MLMTHQTQFSIQEAGKACDLNPSVLRIWESRYGWPRPQRRENGYRVYDYQQIEELKRIAELVRQGHTISSLIEDGAPVIPRQQTASESPYARLDALPLPIQGRAREAHATLINALRHQQFGAALGIIERANFELHPGQLANACYVPTLVTLAETQRLPSGSPATNPAIRASLRGAISARCTELNARYQSRSASYAFLPLRDEDRALAECAVLIANMAPCPARLIERREDADGAHLITVCDRWSPLHIDGTRAHLSALENGRGYTLTQLPHALTGLGTGASQN